DAQVLELFGAHPKLTSERDRTLGDAEAVSAVLPLGGLEVEGEQLEHRHVRALEVLQARAALIGEGADYVAGEDEESTPGDEREEECRIHPARRDGGVAVESNDGLEEGDESDDEHRRPDRAAPSEIEAGGDDRQMVEAQKGDLLVDEPVDHQHRADEE